MVDLCVFVYVYGCECLCIHAVCDSDSRSFCAGRYVDSDCGSDVGSDVKAVVMFRCVTVW